MHRILTTMASLFWFLIDAVRLVSGMIRETERTRTRRALAWASLALGALLTPPLLLFGLCRRRAES